MALFNSFKDLSSFYNIPERTLRDWDTTDLDNYRNRLLQKLDEIKLLEDEAVAKFKEIFTKKELQNLLGALIRADVEVIPINLKKDAENAILYDEYLTDIEKKVLLNKLEKICNFEIYALLEALFRFNRGEEFSIPNFINYLYSN